MSNLNIRKVKDAVTKEEFYPQTCIEAVVDENGDALGIDASPTDDSDKLVRSGGVKAAIDNEAAARAEAVSGEASLRAEAVSNEASAREAADASLNIGVKAALAAVSAEQQRAVQVENTKYSKPAGGIPKADLASYVQASLELAQDVVYDISAHNNNTAYASLAAALGTGGANIPQSLRKGGMSVKFVLSSDNKYVQYRLMAQNFTTDTTQWQGVDDELTAGSNNLVKSSGIISVLCNESLSGSLEYNTINGYYIAGTNNPLTNVPGSKVQNSNTKFAVISLTAGKTYKVSGNLSYGTGVAGAGLYSDSNCDNLIEFLFDSVNGTNYEHYIHIRQNCYLGITFGVVNCREVSLVPKVLDGSITESKLGNGSVTTDKLGNGSVNISKLSEDLIITLFNFDSSYVEYSNIIENKYIRGNYQSSIVAPGTLVDNNQSDVIVYPLEVNKLYRVNCKVPYGDGVSGVALYSDSQCSNLISLVKDSSESTTIIVYIQCATSCYIGVTKSKTSVSFNDIASLDNLSIRISNKSISVDKLSDELFNAIFDNIGTTLSRDSLIDNKYVAGPNYGDGNLVNNNDASVAVYKLLPNNKYNLSGRFPYGDGVSGAYLYRDIDCTNKIRRVIDSSGGNEWSINNFTVDTECYIGITIRENTTANDKVLQLSYELKKPDMSLPLNGYELFSLGDSLSVSGKWQAKIAELTGCTFDNAKNNLSGKELSIGGMSSYGMGFFNLLWRTRNLIRQNCISNDGENAIIILQNANDAWGTPTFNGNENTYIPTEPIEAGLLADFDSSVLQNIPAVSRSLNSVLKLENIVQGTNLKIVNLPTVEGNVRINIVMSNTGAKSYNIHVIPQATDALTLQYCLDRILEYDYAGCNDTLADDGVSVDFSEAGSGVFRPSMSFNDIDNTGMTVLISDTDNAKTSIAYYYNGSTIDDADWTNVSKWQQGISFGSGLKSSIELLKRTYPKAHIFMSDFPVHMDNPSNYLDSRGIYDEYAYANSAQQQRNRNLWEQYGKVAKLYNIPVLRCHEECGITISNYSTYYYDNNVHPKDVGYYKAGEILAAELLRFFANSIELSYQ